MDALGKFSPRRRRHRPLQITRLSSDRTECCSEWLIKEVLKFGRNQHSFATSFYEEEAREYAYLYVPPFVTSALRVPRAETRLTIVVSPPNVQAYHQIYSV